MTKPPGNERQGVYAKVQSGVTDTRLSTPQGPPDQASRILVDIISVSRTSQVRVLISEWRGARRLEFRTYTATIPECWMPSGVPVSLPVEKLDELMAALSKARAML